MDKFIKVAREAAEKAGNFLKNKINKVSSIKEKHGVVDIITDADIKAQKIIVKLISENFPDHGILAEEEDMDIREKFGKFVWVIDPIDGTSAFASGFSTYSSSIALLKDKKPIVGAIYLAISDEVIWTAKGKGVFTGKKKLRVNKTSSLAEASIGFDPSYTNREEYMKIIAAPLCERVRILPMIWSQAAALALVGKGILDGYIQCNSPKVWDAAAGKLLVEEAGGVFTDFTGGPVDLFNINGYVGGSKTIHKQLLEFVD